ncbi:branched-chain amino acid ABC transporter permease [Acidisoma cellulosilytica]|uniref:Branched-chain amino acid ABC transporter permease n=1 Tax=Acidisoma cellulosilyticum TaxID=2802395 RepID=A0A964E4Y0_9PROT|nr:branched-chain amino acid ABC transporter permease [Acidisoma cellulosilyticum]MCB8881924.1 branched-chain amino acid ABC transporter permease [Acidisoma cellulosilyticum]
MSSAILERQANSQGLPGLKSFRGPFLVLLVFAVVIPQVHSDYLFDAILTPFLAISLAALGLNLLTGYAGQVSLGSAAFMAVGAFAGYNFLLRIPGLPLLAGLAFAGLTAAVIGIVFGLPSLRLRGFYLAVSTLATQFFVQWALTNISWFSNDDTSGVISPPPLHLGGFALDSPVRRYLLCLGVVAVLTFLAMRLVSGQTGRALIAVRDSELGARVLGVKVLRTKLFIFAVSSFYIGVAGALWSFAYLRTIEPDGFDLDRSFQILFVIIIGGLASIRGAFLGAAFIVVLPLLLSRAGAILLGPGFDSGLVDLVQKIFLGALIILFLRLEPAGLSALVGRLRIRRNAT